MVHAIRVLQCGGPDILAWEHIDVADPGPGEARVRQTAIGVNYIDTYHRSGLYPQPLPFTLGVEGVGVVEAVGAGVSGIEPGTRVGYASVLGAYAEVRLVPADRLVKLPDTVADDEAAALLLRGMTVEYLIRRTFPIRGGEWVVFHAAAGGVGTLAVPWLKSLGASVIATAGSDVKCALANSLGADHVINYRAGDWVATVREITNGTGVDVVYDGVGRDTCLSSMDCLRRRGTLVSFGNASGPAPAIDPLTLATKGSLHLTRPTLAHYIATREELDASANALFDVVRKGVVKPTIGHRYPLANAAQAHRDLESRRTTGSVILMT